MIPTQHSVYICAVRNEVQDMGANTNQHWEAAVQMRVAECLGG